MFHYSCPLHPIKGKQGRTACPCHPDEDPAVAQEEGAVGGEGGEGGEGGARGGKGGKGGQEGQDGQGGQSGGQDGYVSVVFPSGFPSVSPTPPAAVASFMSQIGAARAQVARESGLDGSSALQSLHDWLDGHESERPETMRAGELVQHWYVSHLSASSVSGVQLVFNLQTQLSAYCSGVHTFVLVLTPLSIYFSPDTSPPILLPIYFLGDRVTLRLFTFTFSPSPFHQKRNPFF